MQCMLMGGCSSPPFHPKRHDVISCSILRHVKEEDKGADHGEHGDVAKGGRGEESVHSAVCRLELVEEEGTAAQHAQQRRQRIADGREGQRCVLRVRDDSVAACCAHM